MTWWRSFSAAKALFVVVAPRPHPGYEWLYREASRRIERGRYESFREADLDVAVLACSPHRFMPECPVPGWNHRLPDNLPEQWAASTDLEMVTVEVSGLRIHVPAALDSKIVLPPSVIAGALQLRAPWDVLFPGHVAAAAIPFRDELRRVLDGMNRGDSWAKEAIETHARELTTHVNCPDDLPLWDLLAAEDPEDALAQAHEELALDGADWPTLRASDAFSDAVGARSTPALVCFGWAGVIWLELAVRGGERRCHHPGCSEAIPARNTWCSEHGPMKRKEGATRRKRQQRAREV